MSCKLVLNHVANTQFNMPKHYFIPRRHGHQSRINIGTLTLPGAYANKRIRLRLEIEVLQ